MVLSVHILTGAAIAVKTQNPILGLLFAFFSHYLIDIIPHQEYSIQNIKDRRWKNSFGEFSKVFLDILIGLLIVLIFTKDYFLAILGGFLAILPDALTLLDFLHQNHDKIHWFKNNKKISLFWEILSQIIVAGISIIILL